MPHALRRSFARKNENKTQFSGPENVGRLTTSRRSRRMIWRCERHTYNNGNASTTSRMYNITTATDDDAVGPKCHRDKFNWVFEKFIVCQAEANTKHTYVSYVVICAICNCLCGSGQTLQVHHMFRLPPQQFSLHIRLQQHDGVEQMRKWCERSSVFSPNLDTKCSNRPSLRICSPFTFPGRKLCNHLYTKRIMSLFPTITVSNTNRSTHQIAEY